MKDLLLKLMLKVSGAGKILGSVNGYKTYIAGAGLICLGLGHLLTGIAATDLTSLPAILDLVKQLPDSPGMLELLNGLGLVGLRHSGAKLEAAK